MTAATQWRMLVVNNNAVHAQAVGHVPVRSFLLWRDIHDHHDGRDDDSGEGQIIDEFAQERRLFAPAETIPDLVKQAFISAEDKNFYTHDGYDLRGIGSAAFDAVKSRGRDVRGASTITQQVMKNFLLSGDRQAERKIKEIILAARVEEALSKEKILELYMNEIFLGQNS